MRSAGSAWNDFLDRDIDAKVERTRARPLPAGELRPRAALLFMVLLSLLGAAVLVTFNGFSIGLGLCSLAVVAIYPLMKRITFWPQTVLGLAFAWGALMGWAALFGSLDWPPLLLYAGAIAWTIAYDTIYALQDLRDDSIIGVRSTARLFGGRVRLAVGSFQALAVILVTLSLVLVRGNVFGYLGCAGFAAHLAWQTASIDIDNPAKALMLFRSNWAAGLILFAGLVADAFFASA
jgi:4-hydroxybenzoate polyprenyltransferase